MSRKKILIVLILLTVILSSASAQRSSDIEGSRDYPLISRFKGSVIEFDKSVKWDTYLMPISKLQWKNDGKIFPDVIELEGSIKRLQYSVSAENNASYVYKNYQAALKKAGFVILFEGLGGKELGMDGGEWNWYFYGEDGLNMKKFGRELNPRRGTDNFAYIAAKGKNGDKNVYAAIFIATEEFDFGYGNEGDATVITQDIIEVEPPELGMVTAQSMNENIVADGHIAVYDINFEPDKAVIRDNSSSVLKVVADYLNSHKNMKFFIVGHAAGIGDFNKGMKLSEERAKAVLNELVSKYGADKKQLAAYGVGALCPLASNATEEGRKRNRRVEIVVR